ncbi:Uncharacterized protein Adt_36342 [Abeliophyllum distichum]|uniref:Retrotransposon Copia-like N-terminal domain-containing protein n=1 Tax=Abeliophyllum distichum TaxID=126358 RepID=A0ABD1QHN9_9LAMI
MANAGNIPQNTNSNTLPTSSASNLVPPMLESNLPSPFGVNLTQMPSVKLDKNNFLLWQNMILPIIRGHNLEGHILGTKMCPPEFVATQIIGEARTNVEMIPNPQYTQWMSIDQLLIGWLYSSMTPEIAMRVMGSSSSNQLWLTVKESYGIQNRSRITFFTDSTVGKSVSWGELQSTFMTFENRLEHLNTVTFQKWQMSTTSHKISTPSTVSDPTWFADTGASNHVTADMENLNLANEYYGKEKIMVGNGIDTAQLDATQAAESSPSSFNDIQQSHNESYGDKGRNQTLSNVNEPLVETEDGSSQNTERLESVSNTR